MVCKVSIFSDISNLIFNNFQRFIIALLFNINFSQSFRKIIFPFFRIRLFFSVSGTTSSVSIVSEENSSSDKAVSFIGSTPSASSRAACSIKWSIKSCPRRGFTEAVSVFSSFPSAQKYNLRLLPAKERVSPQKGPYRRPENGQSGPAFYQMFLTIHFLFGYMPVNDKLISFNGIKQDTQIGYKQSPLAQLIFKRRITQQIQILQIQNTGCLEKGYCTRSCLNSYRLSVPNSSGCSIQCCSRCCTIIPALTSWLQLH